MDALSLTINDSLLKIKEFVKYEIVSRILQFSILDKLMRINPIVPYYHIVSDEEVLHVKYIYDYKNITQFKDDIDFLLKHYSPISLFDLLGFLKTGRSLPEKAFLLTFDDGFREMYDIVAPILLQKGISATFFINSDFIDNKTLCYQHKVSILAEHIQKTISVRGKKEIQAMLLKNGIECNDIKSGILSIKYHQKDLPDKIAQLMNVDFDGYLRRVKPYLTSNHIEILIKQGFSIGAHSIDHPLYSLLTLKEQVNQTIESMKFIRRKFCLNYGAFDFPHSDSGVTRQYFTQISDGGLVDISFGTGGMIKDTIPNHIQRFSLEKPVRPAKKIVAYQYARKLVRQVRGTDKIVRA